MYTINDLKEFDKAYHGGVAHISDADYDQIKATLQVQFPDDPYFKTVGARPSGIQLIAHNPPMGSIKNATVADRSTDESWMASVVHSAKAWMAENPNTVYTLEWKLDGVSVDVTIVNGKPVAALRGDGYKGEDVTANLQHALTAPVPGRGEILIAKESLATIQQLQIKAGEQPYSNTRSAVSGIIRRQDGLYSNYLFIVFYHYTSIVATMICNSSVVVTIDTIEAAYKDMVAVRAGLNISMDGAVLKRDLPERFTGDPLLPDGLLALKFPPERKHFTVDRIDAAVGYTGRLTPVVISNTGVQFADKVISRVTAHNWQYIKDAGIGVGATLEVSISMDVIPKIEKVLTPAPVDLPTVCYACGGDLTMAGPHLYCTNSECIGIKQALLTGYIKELDIVGLGSESVIKLCAATYHTPDMLYHLSVDNLRVLFGMSEPVATRLVQEIRDKSNITLSTFISALCLPNIGVTTMDKILTHFTHINSVTDLCVLTVADLQQVDGCGAITASNLVDGLKAKHDLVTKLLQHVTIKPRPQVVTGVLSGNTYCFTGDTLEPNLLTQKPYTREDLYDLVQINGGSISTSVTKKTTHLVVASLPTDTTKAQKARAKNLPIITVGEFLQTIKGTI